MFARKNFVGAAIAVCATQVALAQVSPINGVLSTLPTPLSPDAQKAVIINDPVVLNDPSINLSLSAAGFLGL